MVTKIADYFEIKLLKISESTDEAILRFDKITEHTFSQINIFMTESAGLPTNTMNEYKRTYEKLYLAYKKYMYALKQDKKIPHLNNIFEVVKALVFWCNRRDIKDKIPPEYRHTLYDQLSKLLETFMQEFNKLKEHLSGTRS